MSRYSHRQLGTLKTQAQKFHFLPWRIIFINKYDFFFRIDLI